MQIIKKKKRVQTVTTQQYDRENDSSSGSDYEQVDSVTIKETVNAVSQVMIKAEKMVKGKPIAFQLDSGASVNVLNEKHVVGKTLEHSNKTLVMWNGAEVKPLGECRVKMINPKTEQKYAVKFVIVKEDFHHLLGENAIQKMTLITVNNGKFISQHSDSIINEFEDDVKEACRNFVKELVILFHRISAAPWRHVTSIIKKSSTGYSSSYLLSHNC